MQFKRSITPPIPSSPSHYAVGHTINTHKNDKYYSLDTTYNYERRVKHLQKNKTLYQDEMDALRLSIQKEMNETRLLIKTLENTDTAKAELQRRLQLYRGCDIQYYHLVLGKIQGETHRYDLTAMSIKEKEQLLRTYFIELQSLDSLYKENERIMEMVIQQIHDITTHVLEKKRRNWWKGVIRCL